MLLPWMNVTFDYNKQFITIITEQAFMLPRFSSRFIFCSKDFIGMFIWNINKADNKCFQVHKYSQFISITSVFPVLPLFFLLSLLAIKIKESVVGVALIYTEADLGLLEHPRWSALR